MAAKNLSELSTTELTEKEKTLKKTFGAFMGLLSLLALMIILLFVQNQDTVALPLLAVLSSLSLVLLSTKKQISAIKAELETRNNNNMI